MVLNVLLYTLKACIAKWVAGGCKKFCQLLKNIAIFTKPNTLVTLCPKTALALTGCGCAEWEFIPLSAVMSYPKALAEVRGKAKFTGQACLKNRSTKLPGAIRALRLLNEERNPI